MYSKSVETEVVFTKTEMNNKWNINFLQNSPFNIFIQVFFIGQITSETSLLICSEPSFEINFQFRKQVKDSWNCLISMKDTTLD